MAKPAGQGGGGFAAEPGFQPGGSRQEVLLGRRELPGVAQRDPEENPRVERFEGFAAEGLRARLPDRLDLADRLGVSSRFEQVPDEAGSRVERQRVQRAEDRA